MHQQSFGTLGGTHSNGVFNFNNGEISWVGNPTNMPVKTGDQMQQTHEEWVPQDQNWIEAPTFSYSSQNSDTTTTEGTDAQTIFLNGMKQVRDAIAQIISIIQYCFVLCRRW